MRKSKESSERPESGQFSTIPIWLTWCEPMKRVKPMVVAGDIPLASAWFKEKTGQDARIIYLSPSLSMLEVPDGIEVKYIEGCLAWEIWLSGDSEASTRSMAVSGQGNSKEVSKYPGGIKATVNEEKNTVAIIQPSVGKVIRAKRGPKHRALPVELIEQWHDEGLGSKAIAAKLNKKGIKVGFRTVARILSGQRLMTV